jgi:hypothetical protein
MALSNMFHRINNSVFLSILSFFLLAGGLVVSVYLAGTNQNYQKKASVPAGTATITVTPASGSYAVGVGIPLTVLFNTHGTAVSAIALRLQYPSGGIPAAVTATNIQIDANLAANNWSCPITSFSADAVNAMVDISCINLSTTGYVTTSDTTLATFTLTASRAPATNPVVVSFDPVQTIITSKADGQDILLTPADTTMLTIGGGATPTPGNPATFTLAPTSGTYVVGQAIPVTVSFNSGGQSVSGVALRLSYPSGGTSPAVTASGIQVNSSLTANNWTCPITSFSANATRAMVDISCINLTTTGYTTSGETVLATFTLTASGSPAVNPVVIAFDPVESLITRKSDGQNIAQVPTGTGTYTIQGGTPATPSPTAAPSTPVTPTPLTTISPNSLPPNSPTPVPTQTTSGCQPQCANKVCGNDGCDGSCGACGQGLACYNFACVYPNSIPQNNTGSGLVGDLTGDGRVDIFDLGRLLSQWDRSGSGDLNHNGKVDIFDLSILLSHWTR